MVGAARWEGCRFNSRAHGGRDDLLRLLGAQRNVSIHAPTGGATPSHGRRRPVRTCFNSRAHGGRDQDCGCLYVVHRAVSIHAPTGGATRPPCGRRRLREFQFTRPRGARQRHGVTLSAASGFNSRAHGGRDVVEDGLLAAEEVSIHAPTGGATTSTVKSPETVSFQFTRPRGARRVGGNAEVYDNTFQFTRPRGARLARCPPSPPAR